VRQNGEELVFATVGFFERLLARFCCSISAAVPNKRTI